MLLCVSEMTEEAFMLFVCRTVRAPLFHGTDRAHCDHRRHPLAGSLFQANGQSVGVTIGSAVTVPCKTGSALQPDVLFKFCYIWMWTGKSHVMSCHTCVPVEMAVSWTVYGRGVMGGWRIAAAVGVIGPPALFGGIAVVVFSVLYVVVTSLAAFSLLAASVLVAVSGSWAVALCVGVPVPLAFLFLLLYFSASVWIIGATRRRQKTHDDCLYMN